MLLKTAVRWLKTDSNTFQDLDFDVSLYPLFNLIVLRLVFTSDGVGVGVLVGVIRELLGAFHSTKYSGLKFRVFHATNGTVIFRFVRLTNPRPLGSKFRAKNTRSNGGLFHLCLLALGLLNDSEVKINDVLGEGDNIPFIVRI